MVLFLHSFGKPKRLLAFISEPCHNSPVLRMNFHLFRERFHRYACFSLDQVRAAFPSFDRGNLHEWLRHGYLLRLRRGWFAFSDAAGLPGISDHVAGILHSPSYLSCETVLSRCGLIPESVVQLTSCTTLKPAFFENAFGQFSYRTLKPALFFGYAAVILPSGLPASVATPAKALCDYLYLNPSLSSTPSALEELRLDPGILAPLFDSGDLPRTAVRFASATLSARVALLRKVCLP